jgi:hypothetical protein
MVYASEYTKTICTSRQSDVGHLWYRYFMGGARDGYAGDVFYWYLLLDYVDK